MMEDLESRIDLTEFSEKIKVLKEKIGEIIVGQEKTVDLLLTALLADGHVLLEGVPGVAKTLLAKLMAKLIQADFSRIQFTPDLMPSDVLGTSIFNLKSSEFEFVKGPVFSEIVLIDEINRAPAKTQAALFEVMEEHQVTVDGFTRKMNEIYMVIATQNPVEQEGTYRLPEAQLDRFLMKVVLGYPKREEEFSILKRHHENNRLAKLDNVNPILTKEELIRFMNIGKQVFVEDSVLKYITDIIISTRNSKAIYLGASPRAGVALLNAAKAFAILQGRDFVIPDDIKYLVVPVLQHRIMLSAETEMEGRSAASVIKLLVEKIDVPK
ncbi:MoxR family ATPase [Bacteroidales bacterium OttesenSCG-928-M06]|nr:MoxR family ATPase [Bacteroidales bacterium OttesenSCG-928-M06]